MRLGAFLFGGLVGAAAAIYVANKTKPFAWSAWTGSDLASSFLNATGNQSGNSKKNTAEAQPSFKQASTTTASPAKSNKKETAIDEDLFKADGLNKVGDIVNQDPKLRAAVDEIMAGNSQKSEQRAH
ncbi:hypothetical protein [Paenibacillus sp.]|uniref:hypothetical protein n=1 Tax=Paenibacillus sp. TaxID=58172 RepID=UPI00356287F1